MNKSAIKSFAMEARRSLIDSAKQRAYEYEITAEGENIKSLSAVGGHLLTNTEKEQRRALIERIEEKGFDEVMEEAAYTWFNRFIALRYMEVNGFLPSRVRVFTNEDGDFKPEIMKEAMTVEIDGLDREKIFDLLENQNNEELYKYLLITQCNALGEGLPKMFEKISDWTELLFPSNLLRPDSIIARMVKDIPEEDFTDIEIIGWMYQYYITERHEQIVNPLHSKAYTKEEVPAATQIFTTEWVVKYIVDNSLGRYWIERNPQSELKNKLEYLVIPKSGSFEIVNENVRPEEITVLDPCVGSGHFLSYAFEVLMMIYTECGWSERDAAKSIIERNLYGLDIDARAGQLAYFTLMMKARGYNRRAIAGGAAGFQPNVHAIEESNHIDSHAVADFVGNDSDVKAEMDKLLYVMNDAKEYGSILNIKNINFELLLNRCDECADEVHFYQRHINEDIIPLIKTAYVMAQRYNIVVTNPPYMNKFSPKLKDFINKNYAAYKGDLFIVFIYKCFEYCKQNGYTGAMTPNVWMFIKTYEELRKYIINQKNITTLVQMAKGAFFKEATVDVCGFVLQNAHNNKNGQYIRLEDFKGDMDVQGQKTLEALANKDCGYYYETTASNFSKIPGLPIAYWVSDSFLKSFTVGKLLGSIADSKQGIATADNNKYLRLWFECNHLNIYFDCSGHEKSAMDIRKWYPYNKGGEFRKWYGNNEYVVNWYKDGIELKGDKKAVLRNPNYYFKSCFSWSLISSSVAAFRYKPQGHLFDVAGMSCFTNKNFYYLLALCNTNIVMEILKVIAPTINYQCGDIANIPVIVDDAKLEKVEDNVKKNIYVSKSDWDSFETSWDFKKHPLI